VPRSWCLKPRKEEDVLKLKEVKAAVIDATLIESAARPRSAIEAPQDRAEGDAPTMPRCVSVPIRTRVR
jgi:IS5 family transposase